MTGRRWWASGVVAALLVLGACSGGGGGGDSGQGITPPTEPEAGVVTTTTTPAGDIETFEVFSTKNPFTPLAGPQTGDGGTPTGTGGTGGTSTGGTSTGGTGTTTGGEGGAVGGVEPQRAQRIALVDVFTEAGEVKANVRVNSTVHKVGVGDTFADRYKVLSLSLSDECGRFLFGDSTFRLCKGEQALK